MIATQAVRVGRMQHATRLPARAERAPVDGAHASNDEAARDLHGTPLWHSPHAVRECAVAHAH
jgi:hypothetical protein